MFSYSIFLFFMTVAALPALVLFFRAVSAQEEKPGGRTLWILFIIGLLGMTIAGLSGV